MARKPRKFLWAIGILLSVAFLGSTASPAVAGTAEEINVLPTLDPLNRTEEVLSNSERWSALGWDSSTTGHNTGRDTTSGWGPYDAFSTVNGAFWSPSTFNDKTGDAAAVTMQTAPGLAERYVSLWIDMPNPASAKTGYQLRWTSVSGTTYSVTLAKYSAGAQTVLASNSAVTIPAGATLAISDTGGTVTAWQGSGGSLSSILSASDTTFTSGYAGIEASGNNSRSTNFKAGVLIGPAITGVPVLDNLERQEVPLATGKWTKTSWAGEIGGTWMGSYRGYGSSGGLAGAYWNQASFSDSVGTVLAAGTVGTGSPGAGEYLAVWLDMPSPGSARSGYEARFTGVNGSATNYKVELSKWAAGTRTVLASKEGFSLAVGTTVALTETAGGSLALWTGTSTMSPILSASDSTYTSGYAGLEVNGPAGTLYNFRAGGIGSPPDTAISSGPKGTVLPNVSLSFTATEGGASFECSLDSGAFSACTSPKAYQGLAEGSHTLRVRAVGAGGADPTPAERSFQVFAAAKAIGKVAVLDNLERQEVPLATGKWTKTSWAGEIGGAWMGGYRGYGSSGGLAGAYWNQASFSDGEEAIVTAATVGTGAPGAEEYLAVWLDMPSPGSARSGYEARFTGVNWSATNYKVELSKWVAGVRTVLASTSGFSLPVGTTMALSESGGGSLTLWTGTSSLTALLSATDSTYTSGYAGLEVSGGAGTLYNFRAGRLDTQAPDTTITSGPSGTVVPEAVSFSFTSTESGSSFECSLDSGAFSACTSPKAYPGISSGSHAFRVRAIDAVGNQDETPAERSFSVAQPPSVTTLAATGIASSKATLNASVNPNGAATTYQFEYGTTTSYGSKLPATPKSIGSGSTSVEVSEPVTGLQPGTVYHFRISATNGSGTRTGEDRTFTTTAMPVATTKEATEVSASESTLSASINPKGAATTYQFEYGTTTSYGSKLPATPKSIGSGSSSVEVSERLTGLQEGRLYHYRVVAVNEVGASYGEDKTFTTLFLPEAETEAPGPVEGEEATLTGNVDPNGTPTEYNFEYGTTTAYGTTIAPDGAGNGSSSIEAVESIGGLQPETTYHYRIVATSQAGADYGKDMGFTTGAAGVSPAESELQPDFFGMQWTGDFGQTDYPHVLSAVKNSGARILRLSLNPSPAVQKKEEEIFRDASHRGITILPYIGEGKWPTDPGIQGEWKKFAKEMVAKYGPGGSFWGGGGHPVVAWEIWNEPNLGSNSPIENPKDPNNAYEKIAAKEFGEFFHKIAEGLKEGANGRHIEILAPSLFSFGASNCENECHLSPANFLDQMEHTGDYDAVSLHPYVFKVKGESNKPHAPTGPNQVGEVKEKVENFIRDVRSKLKELGEPNKKIWVTELGFPVAYANEEAAFPSVSPEVQKEEIEATFGMMKKKRDALGIGHAFYFDIQDASCSQLSVEIHLSPCPSVGAEWPTWAYHCGLRRAPGGNRPAWKGFTAIAPKGHPNWSSAKKAKNTTTNRRALGAVASYDIETQGARYEARAEWGSGPLSTSYPNSTAWQVVEAQDEGEADEEAVDVEANTTISGLQEKHVYHYRIAVKDENGEVEQETNGHEFETKPLVSASINPLNGEPGWVNVSGHVESETPLNNTWVNINFKKWEGSEYVSKPEENTHANLYNGDYSLVNWGIGRGKWQVNVVFEGNSETPRGETGLQAFTIKNGYKLIAKHSQKCLDVYQGNVANGTPMIQYTCGDPQGALNQIFSLIPVDNQQHYQIVARHSDRCVGVTAGSQQPGVQLSQYDCLGPTYTHQIWKSEGVLPNGPENFYNHFVAQNSGQCMEVQASSLADGGIVDQYPCAGTQENQLWTFESVEGNQVPTQTFWSEDENDTYHGMPGFISFHGRLDTGGRAYPLAGRKVHIIFERQNAQGGFEQVPGEEYVATLNSAGEYSYLYWGIGHDTWHIRAVFYGTGDALGQSESETHTVVIKSGYRLMFRSSQKCLSASENHTANGTMLIQWTCDPNWNPWDGQTFSLYPIDPPGSNHWQLRPNTANNPPYGQCVDVYGASTANGAPLNLYQCTPGANNQVWSFPELLSQPGWFGGVALHSNKCMDVTAGNPANGVQIEQYECIWNGNQQFAWQVIP